MIAPTCAASLFAAPNWQALLDEYADEVRLEGMPPAKAKFETYDAMERAGMLHSFDARIDGLLVGFIAMLAIVLPHYNHVGCVTESFYVSKAYRQHLVGLKLLAAAEEKAAQLGSPGLLVSAPYGGKLFELLPRCGYVETNRVFFKKVAHG